METRYFVVWSENNKKGSHDSWRVNEPINMAESIRDVSELCEAHELERVAVFSFSFPKGLSLHLWFTREITGVANYCSVSHMDEINNLIADKLT